MKLATSASGVSVTGSLVASSSVEVGAYIIFEGSTDNDNETTVQVVDPSADRTITIPDDTGTLMTTGGTGNVTSAMIADNAVTAALIDKYMMSVKVSVLNRLSMKTGRKKIAKWFIFRV